MSESDEGPERVEDDARVDDAVVVELAEVLDRCEALLVVLEAVDLVTKCVNKRRLEQARANTPPFRRGCSPVPRR